MIEFYLCAAIDRVPMRYRVEGIENLTDRQILQVLRFLRNHPDDGKRLFQAKASANERLPMFAQRFIVKWCRAKGIRIKTWDISNQAQKGA